MVEYRLDQNWYKPICERCPYFCVTDYPNAPTIEEQRTARCERNDKEQCLADSFLVHRLIMLRRLSATTLLKKTLDAGIKPFVHKKRKAIANIKRR